MDPRDIKFNVSLDFDYKFEGPAFRRVEQLIQKATSRLLTKHGFEIEDVKKREEESGNLGYSPKPLGFRNNFEVRWTYILSFEPSSLID